MTTQGCMFSTTLLVEVRARLVQLIFVTVVCRANMRGICPNQANVSTLTETRAEPMPLQSCVKPLGTPKITLFDSLPPTMVTSPIWKLFLAEKERH